ncbi:hypothetical protein ACFUAC_08890 [Streptomyces sp. NPDC057148]|uniref:hypothetical protein n=1 Tax=unclassified Streptomyces TaxID=2593676 RepID=UPI00362A1BC1
MGIESDQVVFEYLSRVGDVAQQRQLPSATRMRLVSELRGEIDKSRAKAVVDSPAAVRRILDRLGSPDDVVEAAGGTSGAPRPPVPPPTAVPAQPDGGPREKEKRRGGLRRAVPRPAAPEASPAPAASPPHLAGAHELGDGAARRDWWRVDSGPYGDIGDQVPGFVGGVEIPDLLKPPPRERDEAERREREQRAAEKAQAAGAVTEAADPAAAPRRRLRLWPDGGWNNPLLLLAAALLIAGAVLGSLVPLGLGWLIAYLSRRLTPAQSKWAVLGLPGAVAAAGVVWLWGRTEGRWGDPIAEGHMNDAVTETWPWVLRTAAVATALYLLWRARRSRG